MAAFLSHEITALSTPCRKLRTVLFHSLFVQRIDEQQEQDCRRDNTEQRAVCYKALDQFPHFQLLVICLYRDTFTDQIEASPFLPPESDFIESGQLAVQTFHKPLRHHGARHFSNLFQAQGFEHVPHSLDRKSVV